MIDALKAARLKRERARRKVYFAGWYAINRGKVAARRRVQRQAKRLPAPNDVGRLTDATI
jgi:hypothetical protein